MNQEELQALDEFKNLGHSSNWNWNRGRYDDLNAHTTYKDTEEMSSGDITTFIVGLAFTIFLIFLICLCCPFCLLAKYRRRRGHVYSQAQPPIITATLAQTAPPHGAPVVAINATRPNASYPVQQSVTVLPLLNSQSQPPLGQYPYPGNAPGAHQPYPRYGNVPSPYQGHGQGHGPSPMPMPMPGPDPNNDLPPPYPGLPREADSGNGIHQPAYNPYYGVIGDTNQSNPASAPYPTYPSKH